MKKVVILAALAISSLAGCDKIKDATSKDIKVDGVKFDFTAVTQEGGTKSVTMIKTSETETTTFTETRVVDIKEFNSQDVEEYRKKVNDVIADNSKVRVKTTPSGVYTVTNLTITAPVVQTESLVIPSLTVGGVFQSNKKLDEYMEAFATKVLDDKAVVTVTVSGEINAPKGTTVTVTYESDFVFKASML